MRRAALACLLALPLGGCGGDGETPELTVSAAASLEQAFTQYGREFPQAKARFSFAGSDELAAQIEQGVRPDVYAAASTALPQRLYEAGLVEQPTVFAGNRLVLAVPAGSAIDALEDLAADGVALAIAAEGVPVGTYTRTVLDRLPGAQRAAILGNVRTEEPDVAGITGKLTQGAVDAGFLYLSDVRATDGAVEAVELPDALQPDVAYGVAVVRGAEHPDEARAFVAGLLDGRGAQALERAGFEPPPVQ